MVVPWQWADLAALGLTAEECRAAVQYVEDGRARTGGAAVARALQRCREPWRSIGMVLGAPALSAMVEAAYAAVAANRYRLPGATPACRLR